jgi:hypothetical protein
VAIDLTDEKLAFAREAPAALMAMDGFQGTGIGCDNEVPDRIASRE